MSGSPLIIGASTEALGAITTLELLKITCSTALAAPSHLILPPRARSRQSVSSHLDPVMPHRTTARAVNPPHNRTAARAVNVR
jgi:hypothetical protein